MEKIVHSSNFIVVGDSIRLLEDLLDSINIYYLFKTIYPAFDLSEIFLTNSSVCM